VRARLERDFESFGRELPRDFPEHARAAYGIDLSARYLGETIPHPIGKGSGQLSLNVGQLEDDAAAGLAFTVLKTVIAEDETGAQAMAAWAIHETKMKVEQWPAADGRRAWTVTWKGRGWDRSLADYLALVRAGRDLTRVGRLLVVPSVKYHLPRLDEPFREAEYRHTTTQLAAAWVEPPLLVEKDFSPTLAGDALTDDRAQVLRWLREVPGRIRVASPVPVRVAVKLMNARFDDAFQVEMAQAATGADALVCFNRLFDGRRAMAYGGWDLSERNLRALDLLRRSPGSRPGSGLQLTPRASAGIRALTGTGNVCSGQMILEYARRGCESVQLHTFFQLPLSEYSATHGSRTARALHALVFHPQHGLIAGMLELEARGALERRTGELHFLDVRAHAHRAG
jgi:dihydroorotate dehydrogenase